MKSDGSEAFGPRADYLKDTIESVLWAGGVLPECLEAEALAIAADFLRRREQLQQPFLKADGGLPKELFATLRMEVRWAGKGGKTLELNWILQHFHKGRRRKPKHLNKGPTTRYRLGMLKQHAQPYEWGLVQEFEEKAESFRRRWVWMQKIREANRYLARDPFAGDAKRVRPVASGRAELDDVVLPPGVTREAWEAYRAMPGVYDPRPEDLLPTAEQFRRVSEVQ